MKILVVGAGVIGQIYAARLYEAGHEVTVLARHQTLQALTQDGITLVNEARPDPPVQRVPVRVEVTGEVGLDRSFELTLVTVRRDQVDEILPALAGLPARLVVMMQNNSLDLAHVSDIVGHDRTLFGFPGVGGYRRDDGAISYIEIPQQPTTLGRQQGGEDIAGAVFRSAGAETAADTACAASEPVQVGAVPARRLPRWRGARNLLMDLGERAAVPGSSRPGLRAGDGQIARSVRK